MMFAPSPASSTARPPLITTTVEQLPANLPAVDALPTGTTDHDAPERWFEWNLATMTWPNGYSPTTGEPVMARQRIVAAPYTEYKDAVRLDRSLPFEQVVAIAQARAGFEHESAIGIPQAVLQASDGAWFLTSAGYLDGQDHIEPISLDLRPITTQVRQHVRELKAIVDQSRWVNFTTSRQ